MHGTLEEVQMTSRKPIRGNLRVYFSIFVLLFVVASGSTSVYLTSMAIFTLLGVYSAGKSYLRLMKVPTYFLIPSALVIALFIPGRAVTESLPISPTEEGIGLAVSTVLRSYASLSVLFFMIVTTSIPEVFSALKSLRLPGFVIEMALLMYRAIQVLMDELVRLDRSASSRLGYSGWRAYIRTASLLGYSLFVKSLERAEKMNMAMESRCYSGSMPVRSEKSSGYLLCAITVSILILSMLGVGV
ncbi:cobalt ECF transporter T component CbiQ [Geoglobus sp.]